MDKKEFEALYNLNVNEHKEDKNGLSYLSWSWAWAEFKKVYPNAEYEIWKDEQGRPYIFDPNLGYMVYTRVTVDGLTHEMWLPVMDSNNYAMKDKPYEVQTKYKTVTVKPATMMDINKAIMRCLTKNLAMFGLGLYIYAGEDLPEDEGEAKETKTTKPRAKKEKLTPPTTDPNLITADQAQELCVLAKEYTGAERGISAWLAKQLKLKYLEDATKEQFEITRDYLKAEIERKKNENHKADA